MVRDKTRVCLDIVWWTPRTSVLKDAQVFLAHFYTFTTVTKTDAYTFFRFLELNTSWHVLDTTKELSGNPVRISNLWGNPGTEKFPNIDWFCSSFVGRNKAAHGRFMVREMDARDSTNVQINPRHNTRSKVLLGQVLCYTLERFLPRRVDIYSCAIQVSTLYLCVAWHKKLEVGCFQPAKCTAMVCLWRVGFCCCFSQGVPGWRAQWSTCTGRVVTGAGQRRRTIIAWGIAMQHGDLDDLLSRAGLPQWLKLEPLVAAQSWRHTRTPLSLAWEELDKGLGVWRQPAVVGDAMRPAQALGARAGFLQRALHLDNVACTLALLEHRQQIRVESANLCCRGGCLLWHAHGLAWLSASAWTGHVAV